LLNITLLSCKPCVVAGCRICRTQDFRRRLYLSGYNLPVTIPVVLRSPPSVRPSHRISLCTAHARRPCLGSGRIA
jgi:hypothetical protein